MNTPRAWLKMALLFLMAAVIGFVVPTTMAYLVDNSATLLNTFIPAYMPPEASSVEICVEKTMQTLDLEPLSPKGFDFRLQSAETGEYITLTTDANGQAAISIPFTDADIGKTYQYSLYEVNDGRENVTYDDTVYSIRISLSVNDDNQVAASVTMNGESVQTVKATFKNIYSDSMILPPTGDEAQPVLYAVLLLLSSAGLVILLKMRNSRRFN